MVIVLVAATAAVLGVVATLVATRLARARSRRRLAPGRARIDAHLQAISDTLDRVAVLAATATEPGREELDPSLDLDSLLEQLASEAAAVTGAQAVAIRVEGPDGAPVVASFGTSDGAALLENALGPPDARPFRALTINWTYGPAGEDEEGAFSSALVVPVVEEGVATGALVAYTGSTGSFESEHLRALRALADQAAPGITSARRFAVLGHRSLTDELTGIRNRSGYELELEREVARAHRTGRPLSLLVVKLRGTAGTALSDDGADDELQQFATLLRRTARTTDIPCRRRAQEFAVVLPETRDDGARHFWTRLQEETGTSFGKSGQRTFSAGLVEWRPNETSDALDARAAAAVAASALLAAGGGAPAAIELGRRREQVPEDRTAGTAADPRRLLLEHAAGAVAAARRLRRPLAVVAADVEVEPGEGAAALRAHVAARIDDALDEGSAISWVEPDRPVLVLPGATAADAQALVAVLQASLDVRPPGYEPGRVAISAGIAELAADEDAPGVLRRAQAALEQARRGTGAVELAPGGDDAS
jgi:diguanylate cyclase (GGDEF)-like protein